MIKPLQSPPPAQRLSVLKELVCPNCGSPIQQHTPNAQTMVCTSCGSYVGMGMDGPDVLDKGRSIGRPPKPIEVGQTATFKNTSYFVLGRVAYEGWDMSDSSDRWKWTEWLLGAADGRMFWLSYDDEAGFVLFHKIRIRQAFNPHSGFSLPIKTGQSAAIKERYPARIVGAEGELTWQAKPNDQMMMVEAHGSGKQYSLQVSGSELEMYEGMALDESAVAKAFGNEKWSKQAERKQKNQELMVTSGMVLLGFGVIALILAAIAWNTGSKAATETVRLDTNNPVASIPVNFEDGSRPAVVSLKMEGSLPVNTYAEVDVSVVDPEDVELYVFSQEFWHETGYDEGQWDESDYSGSGKFIPGLDGTHDIEVELGERSSGINSLTVEVEIKKNHMLPTWFLGFGIIGAVLGIIVIATAHPKTTGNFFEAIMDD